MEISNEVVSKIATLAKINLDPTEVAKMQSDMNKIMDYCHLLSNLNTDNVAPTAQVIPVQNVFREDIERQSLRPEEIRTFAYHCDASGHITVPKVIE